METLIFVLQSFGIVLLILGLAFLLMKYHKEKRKNDILTRRDKSQAESIKEYQTKLRVLSPNRLSFRDKMKHDFHIKKVLSQIANTTEHAFCASGCLFHNGGNIPTQLSMIYSEKSDNDTRNPVVDIDIQELFQCIPTNKVYEPVLAIIDSKHFRINDTSIHRNRFCNLLEQSGTNKFLAVCIRYDEKTPVMFIGVHFTDKAKLTEELIESIKSQVDLIHDDVINLFAYKLKN